MKLYLLLAAIVAFAFFSNDFGLVDIQKTAVILAAGVDKTQDGFKITAQIAVPKGSDRTTGGTSSVEITGEGETVAAGLTQIYTKTGWVPKLVFCDLVVLGENTGEEDVFSCLDFFLRNEYMPDSCLLAMCEGEASDLLSSTSAIDDASSLAIEKIFSDAAEKSGKVMKTTLKEFSIGYHGVSKSGYMPYIRAVEQKGPESAGGGSQQGSGGGESEPEKIYGAEETALFYEGRMVALLPSEQTFAFSLLKGNVFSGTFTAQEDGDPVSLNVLKNEGGVSLETKGAPVAKLSVSLKVRLHSRGVPAPIEDVAGGDFSPELEQNAAELLQKYISSLWETCKTSGCDLFYLNRALYRSSLKKYREWNGDVLSSAVAKIQTSVKGVR